MKYFKSIVLITLSFLLIIGNNLRAQVNAAPAQISAILLVKVIGFEKNISKNDISIYVLGSPPIADALQKVVGQANIKNVASGNDLPTSKPNILFVCSAANLGNAIKYSQENKVLTVTNYPSFVQSGVTLGFGVMDDKRAKILFNINSSAKEGLDWNPAIMKVAQIIK
jgi:hypothetical protein